MTVVRPSTFHSFSPLTRPYVLPKTMPGRCALNHVTLTQHFFLYYEVQAVQESVVNTCPHVVWRSDNRKSSINFRCIFLFWSSLSSLTVFSPHPPSKKVKIQNKTHTHSYSFYVGRNLVVWCLLSMWQYGMFVLHTFFWEQYEWDQ